MGRRGQSASQSLCTSDALAFQLSIQFRCFRERIAASSSTWLTCTRFSFTVLTGLVVFLILPDGHGGVVYSAVASGFLAFQVTGSALRAGRSGGCWSFRGGGPGAGSGHRVGPGSAAADDGKRLWRWPLQLGWRSPKKEGRGGIRRMTGSD